MKNIREVLVFVAFAMIGMAWTCEKTVVEDPTGWRTPIPPPPAMAIAVMHNLTDKNQKAEVSVEVLRATENIMFYGYMQHNFDTGRLILPVYPPPHSSEMFVEFQVLYEGKVVFKDRITFTLKSLEGKLNSWTARVKSIGYNRREDLSPLESPLNFADSEYITLLLLDLKKILAEQKDGLK